MKTKTHFQMVLLVFLSGAALSAHAFYDPGVQRWLNRDPIEEADGPNQSSFLQNSPIDSIDLWGDEVFSPGEINCLGYAMDFGSFIQPDPSQSLKDLLEKYGWQCDGAKKGKCKGKKGEKVIVVYIYDTSGFPPGSNPFTSPWPSGADFHAMKQCPDKKWRYIPFKCPENTPPSTTPNPKNPDTYWPGGKVPKERYCCTKEG